MSGTLQYCKLCKKHWYSDCTMQEETFDSGYEKNLESMISRNQNLYYSFVAARRAYSPWLFSSVKSLSFE